MMSGLIAARGLLIAAGIVGAGFGVTSLPGTPDFSGTWTLNVPRSDFGPFPAPERRTDVIEHRDGTLVATKTTYEGQDASVEDRWVISPDGRTLTISRSAVSPQGTAHQTFVLERQ